uniref:Uncharacterized protein n=1 Tax=Arundo donax TaxID=35708 RepID=A0A0A9BAJ0_ARUDO
MFKLGYTNVGSICEIVLVIPVCSSIHCKTFYM